VIAVVVSVLYLGLQIRDNTKVLRSQAHYNALSLAQRPMEMIETKPGLTRFWSEFQTSFDEPFRSYVAAEFARKPAAA
jgi:hypothetical protein